MELRQLRYALAVARRRSFTRAASEVAIAQPALSQQIAALERELGVRLFDRTKRRVRLTDAGRAFVARAERVLADSEALAEEMTAYAGGLRGRVAAGMYQSFSEYLLPKHLAAFHARYPGIEIALREGLADVLLGALRDAQIDIFIGDFEDAPLQGAEFAHERLYQDEIALAVSATHPFANRGTISMAELHNEHFVVFAPGSSLTNRLLGMGRAAGFEPRIAFESVDSMTIRALVAEGLGVAFYPRALGNTPGPNIALVSLEPRLHRWISLVTRRTPYSPCAKIFIEFIRERMHDV